MGKHIAICLPIIAINIIVSLNEAEAHLGESTVYINIHDSNMLAVQAASEASDIDLLDDDHLFGSGSENEGSMYVSFSVISVAYELIYILAPKV